MDWIKNQADSAAGGGKASEKKEDGLDKGMPSLVKPGVECNCHSRLYLAIDYVQENVLSQGKQNNEIAVEQAKDEQISDFIRAKYESTTGSKMPIQDKATSLDSSKD